MPRGESLCTLIVMGRSFISFLFITCVVLGSSRSAQAQQYRYMDSSGNIHFVESLNDVPRRYRQQIVPPTPTPVLDIRQRKELQRAKEREAREQQRKIDNKKRELERTRRMIEREQKLQAGRSGAVAPAPVKPQSAAPREDQIEVIR